MSEVWLFHIIVLSFAAAAIANMQHKMRHRHLNRCTLCDLLCVHDSLSIVKSIATETLDYSSKCCQQDKKFTAMCLNP
jgi:hypothetical protein